MQRSRFLSGYGRTIATVGVGMLALLGGVPNGRADTGLALFANQSLKITGSSNLFCGRAHSNGSVEVNGNGNGISGNLEYVDGLKTNNQNAITPVQSSVVPMPQPPHDLAHYRLLARNQGTYFAGSANLDGAVHGLVFAERDIRIAGSGISSTVTLISARGAVKLSGSNHTFLPAIDGILMLAAEGDVSISGSGNSYSGAIFALAGQFHRSGADGGLVSGPVVADSIKWSGARGHIGGDCCVEAAQCDDDNPCTAEACGGGACSHAPIAGCTACDADADCTAANACMRGDCHQGTCRQEPVPQCTPCTTAADCADGTACTTEACPAGVCIVSPVAGCEACASVDDCQDGDRCTADLCSASGVCEHQPQPSCAGCTAAADCDDHNACTEDTCGTDGSCQARAIPGCCTRDSECDDQNDRTLDACTNGMCTHVPQEPPVEICDDGADNDANTFIDCADSACAAFPGCAPRREICGDCADNDGDGLIDYEDADCCAQPKQLGLKYVAIRPNASSRLDRLKLRSIYTRNRPESFDPLKQDTSIQISDDQGQVFCTTISAGHFMPRGQHSVAFWGDGSWSGGLTDGSFTIKPNRTVTFRTHGRSAQVRPSTSRALRVTIRVGTHCSQTSIAPRVKKTALLFP